MSTNPVYGTCQITPCNIVPKNLRLEHLKNRVNTACCLLDSSLINAKFMSYNDRAPPPLTST